MIKHATLILVVSGLLNGCSKKPQETTQTPAAKQPSSSVADMLGKSESPTVAPDSSAPPDVASTSPPDPGGPDVPAAIKAAVKKYVANKKVSPRSWIDLTVEPGYLASIPTGKDGQPLDFEKTMAKLHIAIGP